jgi:hypothetical protein
MGTGESSRNRDDGGCERHLGCERPEFADAWPAYEDLNERDDSAACR